jgi:hypothetical protein
VSEPFASFKFFTSCQTTFFCRDIFFNMGYVSQTLALNPACWFWNGTFSLTTQTSWTEGVINGVAATQQLAVVSAWVESEPGAVDIALAKFSALVFINGGD